VALKGVLTVFGTHHSNACAFGQQHFVHGQAQNENDQARNQGAQNRAQCRVQPQGSAEVKGDVHAQHQKLALGKVDDPH